MMTLSVNESNLLSEVTCRHLHCRWGANRHSLDRLQQV